MNFSNDALKFLFENADKSSEVFEPNRFLPEKLTPDGFPTTDVFVQVGVLCATILEGSAPSEVSMILGIGNHKNHVYSLSVLEDTTTFIVANKASLKACDLDLANKQNYQRLDSQTAKTKTVSNWPVRYTQCTRKTSQHFWLLSKTASLKSP